MNRAKILNGHVRTFMVKSNFSPGLTCVVPGLCEHAYGSFCYAQGVEICQHFSSSYTLVFDRFG